jgi:fructose 1,6-bisphosphatase
MLDLLQDFFDLNVTGLQPSSKDLEVQVAETNPVCCLFAAFL